MTDRMYRPGLRGPNKKFGRIGEDRAAWLKMSNLELTLVQYTDGDQEGGSDEPGDTFVLVIGQPGRRPVTVNLSNMTEEENKMAREFIDLAFDLAKPVTAARDTAARRAADEGDDTLGRLYRSVPHLVKRPWAFGEDGQSLRNGLEDLPPGRTGGGDRPGGGVPGIRDDVASDEPQQPEAEDQPAAED